MLLKYFQNSRMIINLDRKAGDDPDDTDWSEGISQNFELACAKNVSDPLTSRIGGVRSG